MTKMRIRWEGDASWQYRTHYAIPWRCSVGYIWKVAPSSGNGGFLPMTQFIRVYTMMRRLGLWDLDSPRCYIEVQH